MSPSMPVNLAEPSQNTEKSSVDSAKRAQRRQAIVETAARLFAEAGYDDCEMDRIAAEVKIAKGTLYLYFPGKQELFFACVDWGMREMQAAVRAAADAADDPLDKIAGAIRAYLAFFDGHPQYVELLIQERAIFRNRQRPTYFEYRDANRGPWRELYLGLMQAGRIRDDVPVERLLDTVGQLLYGTMFINRFIERAGTLEEQCQALLEVLLRGILSDKERAVASTGCKKGTFKQTEGHETRRTEVRGTATGR